MIPQHFRGYQENERRVLKPSRRANQTRQNSTAGRVLRIISYTFVLFRFCCTISGIARSRLLEQFMDGRTFLKSATAAGLAISVFKPQAHAEL
jgi:hypothetical protein